VSPIEKIPMNNFSKISFIKNPEKGGNPARFKKFSKQSNFAHPGKINIIDVFLTPNKDKSQITEKKKLPYLTR
jgi:hypothetical protein